MKTRRTVLGLMTGTAAVIAGGLGWGWTHRPADAAETFEVTKSADAWRRQLGERAYAVLREADTEPPFSSPLLRETRPGTFQCKGCDQALYDAATKYKSGTGWPSFYDALPGAVGTKQDASLFMIRTEVHCSRCGGHLGHVFDDGPPPTGKRHCINGLALTFAPAETG